MMEIGDIYYNDDVGYHIVILKLEKPYNGWCEVFILETSDVNWYPAHDIEKEIWGWRKMS